MSINNTVLTSTISDFILTPLSCAFLVNEILTNILYQRCQIPYTYSFLKAIIKKKRNEAEEKIQQNLVVGKHYNTVSAAYDSIDSIMGNITEALKCFGSNLRQIMLIFGATPNIPKEVFVIEIQDLAGDHLERNHDNKKQLNSTLRKLFLSEDWMKLGDKSMACTNTYLYLCLETPVEGALEIPYNSIFIPSSELSFSPKIKKTILRLNYENSKKYYCCSYLEMFQDSIDISENSCKNVTVAENIEKNITWLQSKAVIQGFKDCFINKISASTMW